MSDTVITQDGINAVHFTYGSGSLFALKYFMPIYDPRIDPNIHNTPASDTDPLSTYDLSATVPVSATHANVFGDRLFNADGNEIADTAFYLYRIDGEGSLTVSGANAFLTGISQTRATQANLFRGQAAPLTSVGSTVQVISGSNIVGSNGSFTIENYGVVPQFNESSLGSLSDRLFRVHSFAPAIGGTVSADRGQYTAVLDSSVGNFKFNKIAFYMQKVNPDFTDYIGSDPILFCITPIASVAVKTSGTNIGDTGIYGNIGVDGISRIDHVLELEFSTDQTLTNTSYQLVDYWTALPAYYGHGVHFMGDAVLGSSAIDGSYDPLGHFTSWSQDKDQLVLAYDLDKATFFKTQEDGHLHIDTSGTERAYLDFGSDNILKGAKSTVFGANNILYSSASNIFGLNNYSGQLDSSAVNSNKFNFIFGYNNKAYNYDFITLFGEDNSSSATHTFAVGHDNIVNGRNSTSLGSNTIDSNSQYSFTAGYGNVVSNLYGNALGSANTVSGIAAFAAGTYNFALGIHSLVAGYSNTAGAKESIALGLFNNIDTNADVSVAIGSNNVIFGKNAIAGNYGNIVYSNYSSVFGKNNTVGIISDTSGNTFDGNFVAGMENTVHGQANAVFGLYNNVESASTANIVTGLYNTVENGDFSLVIGLSNTQKANSTNSITFGDNNTINSYESLVGGNGNITSGDKNLTFGGTNIVNGQGCITFGDSHNVYGQKNFVNGLTNIVSGSNLNVFGSENTVFNNGNTIFGSQNSTSGDYNFIAGNNNGVYERSDSNALFGTTNLVSAGTYGYGVDSFIGGRQNTLYCGIATAIFGSGNSNYGSYNFLMGSGNVNYGIGAFVGGITSQVGPESSKDMLSSEGQAAFAFGINARAIFDGSVAFGIDSYAYGVASFVCGQGSSTNSSHSIAMGLGNTENSVSVLSNVLIGSYNTINANSVITGSAIVLGDNNTVAASNSFTGGSSNTTYGQFDVNIGRSNRTGLISGESSNYANIAIGNNNYAAASGGICATSIGAHNINSGAGSAILGWANIIGSDASFSYAFGSNNIVYGSNSFAIGHFAYIPATVTNTAVFNLDTNDNSIVTLGANNSFVFNTEAYGDYAMFIRNTSNYAHGIRVEIGSRSGSSPTNAIAVMDRSYGTNPQFPFAVSSKGNIWHDDQGDGNGYKIRVGRGFYTTNNPDGRDDSGLIISTGLNYAANEFFGFNVLVANNSIDHQWYYSYQSITPSTPSSNYMINASPDGTVWNNSSQHYESYDGMGNDIADNRFVFNSQLIYDPSISDNAQLTIANRTGFEVNGARGTKTIRYKWYVIYRSKN